MKEPLLTMKEPLLTVEQVADKLQWTREKVYLYSRGKNPRLPHIRINKNERRYDWPTVVKALFKGALVLILFGLTTGVAGEPQTRGSGNNLFSVTREAKSFQSASGTQGDPAAKGFYKFLFNESRGLSFFATPEPAHAGNKSKPSEETAHTVMICARPSAPSGVASAFGERHRGKPATSGELSSPNALSRGSWFNPSGARFSLLGIIAAVYGAAVIGTLIQVIRLHRR